MRTSHSLCCQTEPHGASSTEAKARFGKGFATQLRHRAGAEEQRLLASSSLPQLAAGVMDDLVRLGGAHNRPKTV